MFHTYLLYHAHKFYIIENLKQNKEWQLENVNIKKLER